MSSKVNHKKEHRVYLGLRAYLMAQGNYGENRLNKLQTTFGQ